MTDKEPAGELYFSKELYGDSMVRFREALEEAGFELNIDPLRDQGTIYFKENER